MAVFTNCGYGFAEKTAVQMNDGGAERKVVLIAPREDIRGNDVDVCFLIR
jgi:hypothetical protein